MPYVPSAVAQALAAAAGNNQASLSPALTALQASIAGGNLAPAAYLDALQTFTSWVEIGSGGGAPAFQNSWVNFGGGFDTAAYLRDALGFVHLKGLIKSGTVSTAAFTLPAGFRPSATKLFASESNGAFGTVQINTAGDVVMLGASNVHQTLEGITFQAVP